MMEIICKKLVEYSPFLAIRRKTTQSHRKMNKTPSTIHIRIKYNMNDEMSVLCYATYQSYNLL